MSQHTSCQLGSFELFNAGLLCSSHHWPSHVARCCFNRSQHGLAWFGNVTDNSYINCAARQQFLVLYHVKSWRAGSIADVSAVYLQLWAVSSAAVVQHLLHQWYI